jgi:hypothetical protein
LSNSENDTNIRMVVEGTEGKTESVTAQVELNGFAEAVISRDEERTAEARKSLHALIGDAALPDAAGIISHFDAINRVADAAGISLDKPMMETTAPIIDTLGISHYEE